MPQAGLLRHPSALAEEEKLTTHPEIEAEQAYFDRAYARIDALRNRAETMSAEVLLSKDPTHQGKSLRDLLAESAVSRVERLRIGRESLIFGRIDRENRERFYIGRFGVPDERFEPLVVDWRAPVAEAFYRATGRNPMGLVRRRYFACKGARIVAIEDELLGEAPRDHRDLVLIGEGALLAALARPRTGRMRDIVETIQSEQDEIIRAPLAPPLVVQGAPGTGKTAVALHRAAYLLYTHRARLSENGILFVGPNPIFLRYVEEVLPSLGEREAIFATPAQLMAGIVVKGIDDEAGRRIKGDARMASVIRNAVRDRERPVEQARRLLYGDQLVELTTEETARFVATVRKQTRTHSAGREPLRRLLLEGLFTRYWQGLMESGKGEDRSARLERADFYEKVGGHPKFRASLDEMWPRLTPQKLLTELFGSRSALDRAASGILDEEERDPLARTKGGWTEQDVALLDEAALRIGPKTKLRGRARAPDSQTESWLVDQLLDEMKEQMGVAMDEGIRTALAQRLREQYMPDRTRHTTAPSVFGHVLVDEAQDLSPMQFRMLRRRCERGSMTIFGDLGQSTSPWTPSNWEEVLPHLPKGGRLIELTINYRTPAEIMEMADRLRQVSSPNLSAPRSVRSGTPPIIESVSDLELPEAAAQIMRREVETVPEGRVGVIVPQGKVEQIRAWCPTELRPPVDQDILDLNLAILEVSDSKGLEFDSVIVIEPALVAEGAAGLRRLYVALTRATQRLTMIHARPLPQPLGASQKVRD